MESTGLPIYRGYFQPDLRTIELGHWEERGCDAAFLLLNGQEQVCEARVTEIPPGATLPPLKFALDEMVYVLQGRGSTSVWSGDGPKRSFEWEARSLFRLPRHHTHQFSNLHGTQPVRLFHYNYLPVAMAAIPYIEYFVNNDSYAPDLDLDNSAYASAKAQWTQWTGGSEGMRGQRFAWIGNFFPDLALWDKIEKQSTGRDPRLGSVAVHFPESPLMAHMSVFPPGTYRKAHRHGPAFAIVIPKGEGFSIMFEEGKEKIICPWQEGAIFVPPDNWFHQHFNVGTEPMRYLALHPPAPFAHYERVGDPANEIDYAVEDPFIRETFEDELAKRGLKTMMGTEVYENPEFEWTKPPTE